MRRKATRAAYAALGALLGLGVLSGCTVEDMRAEAVLADLDALVLAEVAEVSAESTLRARVTEIRWSPEAEDLGGRAAAPELPVGADATFEAPREADPPAAGEQTLIATDYRHPYWYGRLVIDPADGTIRGTTERAVNVREALVAALDIRGRDADRVAILVELVEGAHAREAARRAGKNPGSTGGLMTDVLPRLSRGNGGPDRG